VRLNIAAMPHVVKPTRSRTMLVYVNVA